MNYPIVIPLHPKGGHLRDNTELRFAIRSIERHFKDPFQIVIVGSKIPEWLNGARHLYAEGLKSSLKLAAEHFPSGFFWYYDDCVLLRDTTGEALKVTPACKSWRSAKTKWARDLERIRKRLVDDGHHARDFSRPHGPYWFDKSMVDEGFADWPGMKSKFPWETWILSKRDWPRRHGVVRQYYGPFESPPGPGAHILNYNDKGFSPGLREFLTRTFPAASSFENMPAPNPPRVDIEIHTLRYGSHKWLTECAPTLDAWCETHGHPLRIWTEAEASVPEYPTPKFVVVSILKAFVAGRRPWMGFFDADVYIHPNVPAAPDLSKYTGLIMRQDTPAGGLSFPGWVREVMHEEPDPDWIYRNSGVWFCDRATALALLEVFKAPFHECILEQHHFNYALMKLANEGIPIPLLPQQWNAWEHETAAECCYHFAGKRKEKKLARLRERGLIPKRNTMIWKFEPAFDFSTFGFTLDTSGWSMDLFHIDMVYRAACACGGVAMEIGSYRGASTSALITAVNNGKLEHLHIVETNPTESLRRAIAMCRFPEKVTLWTKPSWEVEVDALDFVLVDGDHRFAAFADAMHAIRRGAKVIVMHDSAAHQNGYPNLWGAWSASVCLAAVPGYHAFEDAERREGLQTERGLLFTSKDPSILKDLKSLQIVKHIQ